MSLTSACHASGTGGVTERRWCTGVNGEQVGGEGNDVISCLGSSDPDSRAWDGGVRVAWPVGVGGRGGGAGVPPEVGNPGEISPESCDHPTYEAWAICAAFGRQMGGEGQSLVVCTACEALDVS